MALSNYCLKLVLLTLVLVVQRSQSQDVVVNVPELGSIRGEWMYPIGVFKQYVQFIGLPYAKSPEGADRFLPPKETGRLAPEGEVFNATKEGNSCVQQSGHFSLFNPESHDLAKEYLRTGDEKIPGDFEENSRQSTRAYLGKEDCLNLNIHTPRVDGRKFPVIVFIHGGSFTSGDAFTYGPGTFFKHDVVLVTINYRLGVLGFFSLETDEAPGNTAIYDMLSALTWVSNYITHFGGDPNIITLMGQSSGGAGVSHLMLSPLSQTPKQLFHRAMVLSASALNPWATIESPIPSSLRIAELAECYDPTAEIPSDFPTIIQCMQGVDPDILVTALRLYQLEERKAGRLGTDAVSPYIQRTGTNRIIPKKPIDVLTAGEQLNIPLIMGAMRHEGSYPLGLVYNQFLNCQTCGELQNNETFLRADLVPTILRSMGINDDTGVVHDALTEQFLGERRTSGNFTQMIPGLIDLQSVFLFKSGAYKNMELHAMKNKDSYWYTFDHDGQYTMFPFLFPYPPPPIPGGVAHGDDVMYFFPFESLNELDMSVSNGLIDYYRNFAWTGNPNVFPLGKAETYAFVRWPTFNSTTKHHLVINKEFSVGTDYSTTWTDVSLELEPQPEPTEAPEESTIPTTTATEQPVTQPPTTPEPPISTQSPVTQPTTPEPPVTQPPTTAEPPITSEQPPVTQPPTSPEPPASQPPTTPEDNGSPQNSGHIPLLILTLSIIWLKLS